MLPHEEEERLSYIVLGTMQSPGVCTLSGHGRELNWDIKNAKGQVGASSSLNGRNLGEFQARFDLADQEDFDAWDAFERLLWSTVNGPKPIALPVYHPDLARNFWTEVVLRHMGEMVHDGRGGRSVIVKLGEHSPPKPKPPAKAQAKPGSPGGSATGTAKPDPNAEAKRELGRLLDEAKRP